MKEWFMLTGTVESIDEINRVSLNNVHPSRIMDSWVLQFVLKGKRTLLFKSNSRKIQQGEFFLLPPNVPHYGMEVDNHDIIYFHFKMSGKEIPPPDSMDTASIILPFSDTLTHELDIVNLALFLLNNYELEYIDPAFFKLQFQSILSYLSLNSQKRNFMKKPQEQLSSQIFAFICQHFKEPLTSSSFSYEFEMSYKQLNNIFRKRYEMTIMQKLTEYRISQASQLLLQGCTITEASELTGFQDYFYFLRVFKKIRGITPSEYMKSYLITK